MRKLESLPKNIEGKSFKTDEGVRFRVVKGDHFSRNSIGRQHHKYLNSLRPGLLVSTSFYGQPVPLIVVNDGVVRLVAVETVDGQLEGSLAISKHLKVLETRQPVGLYA